MECLYDNAIDVSSNFAIHPTMSRRAGRQQNRANPDVQTVSDFYRVTLYYVFLVQEMETRILGREDGYCAQQLLPSKLADLQDKRLKTIYAAFAHDPTQTYEVFKAEIASQRFRWSMIDRKPFRLEDTLKQTCKVFLHFHHNCSPFDHATDVRDM